ncbi:hypothetical protein ASF36_08320 [Methylobacterium sp. Leaf90]|nr:hypothetical protein ASF36_08320 [Methylobacterium sp. Leaf90]
MKKAKKHRGPFARLAAAACIILPTPIGRQGSLHLGRHEEGGSGEFSVECFELLSKGLVLTSYGVALILNAQHALKGKQNRTLRPRLRHDITFLPTHTYRLSRRWQGKE